MSNLLPKLTALIGDPDPSQVLASMANLSQQLTDRIDTDLVNEIDELCQFALGIEAALQEASTIVNAVIDPSNSILLNPVLDALSTCKKQYNATLKESLYVADKAHEAADKFGQLYNDVLSKDETPTDNKKEAIVDYISTLDTEAKSADNLKTYYENLRNEISAYFTIWNGATDLLGIEVPANVAKVDQAIASDVKTIAGLDEELTEPTGAQSDLNDQILQRRVLEADLKAFEALAAIVADVDEAFKKIIHIFNVLTNVWACLRSDLQAIEIQLDLAHETIDKSLLDGRMRTAASMYSALSAALSQYKNIPIPAIPRK
ncbi:hypothetical protein H0H92_015228 [Tricholoma furcatifolium]|nr:hypothetical protein H0H92_015228 [Tricholoma furcatifolium]